MVMPRENAAAFLGVLDSGAPHQNEDKERWRVSAAIRRATGFANNDHIEEEFGGAKD
jgi:hypothetical protein